MILRYQAENRRMAVYSYVLGSFGVTIAGKEFRSQHAHHDQVGPWFHELPEPITNYKMQDLMVDPVWSGNLSSYSETFQKSKMCNFLMQ